MQNIKSTTPTPPYFSIDKTYSSSTSSTVARGGRWVSSPAGVASEPVGCGAESTSVAGAAVVGAASIAPFLGLAPWAFAATLAAFFSFFAAFFALTSSGV
jgi:hypothetical protein